MASMLLRAAALAPEWPDEWADGDLVFRKRLAAAGLDGPIIWAGMRGNRDKVRALLNAMGLVVGDDAESRADFCVALQQAARPVVSDWASSVASLSDLQVSMDVSRLERKRAALSDAQCDSRAKAVRVHAKPAVWHGKANHRAEKAGDENARKRAEASERERWAVKVVKILINAQLPFGIEIRDKGWGPLGHEAGRFFRGLRAATLRKRVSDWGPFLRYLRAHTGKAFPTEKSEAFAYFSVRAEEHAARSVYRALLASLRFFE